VEPPAFQVIFSVLALVAAGGSLVLAGAALVGDRWQPARRLSEVAAPLLVPMAWLVATVATLGSLYFSEVAKYEPCRLCWFQRITMYPLAVILLVGWLRRDRGLWLYVVPLSVIGAAISTYHYYIEWNPESDTCSFPIPCTFVWFRRFGFVSLALMALCGFVSVTVLMLLARRDRGRSPAGSPSPHGR
jgi:disulfide bond formation protein DsbB